LLIDDFSRRIFPCLMRSTSKFYDFFQDF